MPIKMITPSSEIDDYLAQRIDNAERAVIYRLQYIGELVVNRVRSAGS